MTIPRAVRFTIADLPLDPETLTRFMQRLSAQPDVLAAWADESRDDWMPRVALAVRPTRHDEPEPTVRDRAWAAIQSMQGEFGLRIPLSCVSHPHPWWSFFDTALEDIDRVRHSLERIAEHPKSDPLETALIALAQTTAWVLAQETKMDPASAQARATERDEENPDG